MLLSLPFWGVCFGYFVFVVVFACVFAAYCGVVVRVVWVWFDGLVYDGLEEWFLMLTWGLVWVDLLLLFLIV